MNLGLCSLTDLDGSPWPALRCTPIKVKHASNFMMVVLFLSLGLTISLLTLIQLCGLFDYLLYAYMDMDIYIYIFLIQSVLTL